MRRVSISGKLSVDNVRDSNSIRFDVNGLKKELLFALETARSRLAIAIAQESKSTPTDQRRYCLDTTDHMRRFITRLRNEESREEFHPQDWMAALDALRKIPLKDDARLLSSRLRGIVATLE